MKIPYAGQELSTTCYESGGGTGDPRPRKRLVHKLHDMMRDLPARRRVLIASFLLDRCRKDVARAD